MGKGVDFKGFLTCWREELKKGSQMKGWGWGTKGKGMEVKG